MKEKEAFTVRIDKDLLDLIRDIAKNEDRSVNYVINDMIQEYLEKHTK